MFQEISDEAVRASMDKAWREWFGISTHRRLERARAGVLREGAEHGARGRVRSNCIVTTKEPV